MKFIVADTYRYEMLYYRFVIKFYFVLFIPYKISQEVDLTLTVILQPYEIFAVLMRAGLSIWSELQDNVL